MLKMKKIIKNLKCPLCHEEVYSELGKSCKMCGMILDDESREFCSKSCRTKYSKINKHRSPKNNTREAKNK